MGSTSAEDRGDDLLARHGAVISLTQRAVNNPSPALKSARGVVFRGVLSQNTTSVAYESK